MTDIPSRDFGKLEATVANLESRLENTVSHFETRIEKLTDAVESLTLALNQAKGGWKALTIVAAIASAVTAAVLKVSGMLRIVV